MSETSAADGELLKWGIGWRAATGVCGHGVGFAGIRREVSEACASLDRQFPGIVHYPMLLPVSAAA